MRADSKHIYAVVKGGRAQWIFTGDQMPEWNENDLDVRDITDVQPQPAPGWYVDGETWSAEPIARAERIAKLDATLPELLSAAISYKGHTFRADEAARTALLHAGLYVLGGREIPPAFTWPDVDGVPVYLSGADVLALHAALLERNWQVHMALDQARKEIPINPPAKGG